MLKRGQPADRLRFGETTKLIGRLRICMQGDGELIIRCMNGRRMRRKEALRLPEEIENHYRLIFRVAIHTGLLGSEHIIAGQRGCHRYRIREPGSLAR